MLDSGQNPQLSVEPLRESCLEVVNDFASRMEVATKEVHSTLTRVTDDLVL